MSYLNAFKCADCPETNTEKGCPLWWELILTNDTTGESKIEKGCGCALTPELLTMTAKQAMHTTYAAYDMRNKVVKGVGKVIQAVGEKLQIPPELVRIEDDELILLEEKKEDGIS
jgi:hypothetical protein